MWSQRRQMDEAGAEAQVLDGTGPAPEWVLESLQGSSHRARPASLGRGCCFTHPRPAGPCRPGALGSEAATSPSLRFLYSLPFDCRLYLCKCH